MNHFLQLDISMRLILLFVAGLLVGTQINRGIYRLAFSRRDIGPWSRPDPNTPSRHWYDRLPVVGWLFMSRESAVHGRGFWFRPMLIELTVAATFAGLYWFEVIKFGVTGFNAGAMTLHAQYLSHLVLLTLMIIATFIDFDEKTIPDAVTLPGTLLGLMIAASLPKSRAMVSIPSALGFTSDFLHLGSGSATPMSSGWPDWLNDRSGLAFGIGCFVAWCVAVMPWLWTTRRGLWKAGQFWCASLRRSPATIPMMILAVAGSAAITGVWFAGGERWESLLSSLVGMVAGGGTIWAVRIIGSVALKQEAMGFGDVTLMAMIGAFTGWQPTLIIFFMAPFSAILIAVTQYILTRRHDIAFGPYLCLSTVIWQVFSRELWRQYGFPVFSIGWYLPIIGISCLMTMGGLLYLLRLMREGFSPPEDGSEPAPQMDTDDPPPAENPEPIAADAPVQTTDGGPAELG